MTRKLISSEISRKYQLGIWSRGRKVGREKKIHRRFSNQIRYAKECLKRLISQDIFPVVKSHHLLFYPGGDAEQQIDDHQTEIIKKGSQKKGIWHGISQVWHKIIETVNTFLRASGLYESTWVELKCKNKINEKFNTQAFYFNDFSCLMAYNCVITGN